MDELLEDWSLEDNNFQPEQDNSLSVLEENVLSNITNRDDEHESFDESDANEDELCNSLSEQDSLEINPFDGLPYSTMYYELLDRRKTLPVWKVKDDFVLAVDESPAVLVTGRCASGKSTQIPQWCAQFSRESNFQFGTVVCCQPEAISAISLAAQIQFNLNETDKFLIRAVWFYFFASLKVAQEMDFTSVGNEVGYEVPQINCTCEDTILKFCTDDILLQEMGDDPLLTKYSFVIVDEAQERTVATDILLSVLKVVTTIREDLKLIVISLSYAMPILEEYFEGVPIVDLFFLEEETSFVSNVDSKMITRDDEEKRRRSRIETERLQQLNINYVPDENTLVSVQAANLAVKLHLNQEIKGDFIVFLPSKVEIEKTSEEIVRQTAILSVRGECGEVDIVTIHRNLTYGKQQALYERLKSSTNDQNLVNRRIILADSIAESSFSVENIDVVIDSGLQQKVVYNCRVRMHSSSNEIISRSSAMTRTEKCSLQGNVYRLYSLETFQKMDEQKTSPITKSELTSKILLIKRLLPRLNISFAQLQLIEPPDTEAYMLALEELDYHGALDESGNLSDLGLVLSELRLTISQAKTVISSCGEDCVQEVLSVVAMLTAPSCFVIPRNAEIDARKCHERLQQEAGDHFTLLHIYQQFVQNDKSELWCNKHYLNYNSLQIAVKNRKSILSTMENLELPISEPINDPDLRESSIKKALLAGYFMEIAWHTDGCGNYHIIRDRHVARIHPNSNSSRHPEWIIFNKFELDENSYISVVSGITAKWIVEIVPRSYLLNLPQSESKDIILKTVDCLKQYNAEEKPERLANGEFDTDSQEQSQNLYGARKCVATSSRRVECPNNNNVKTSEENYDDTDVITQAVRDATYAYSKASEYLNTEASSQAQCCVQ